VLDAAEADDALDEAHKHGTLALEDLESQLDL